MGFSRPSTSFMIRDTKTPVYGAIASLASTFIVGHALRTRFEIYGLTAATSFAALLQLLVLGLTLTRAIRRRAPDLDTRSFSTFSHAAKALLAALPGVLLATFLARLYGFEGEGRTLVSAVVLMALVGLAAGLYFGMAKILGLEEADLVLGLVRRRLARLRRR